ncbi:MAG: phytanoyl-CoA dioxygenase family protein [Proteobacteria bacterium]|nr:phytanoyl-CoA dioxygenase family protein [Pseudomonadota bacterium]
MMSSLPQPTTDSAQAKGDLDKHGYCILTGLLDAADIADMQSRVPQLAAEERARSLHDQAQGKTDNQYIYMMINKGQVFLDLVQHRAILDMVGHVLGPAYLLSASDAILCKPGGKEMPLHSDQWWLPEPTPRNQRPAHRAGEMQRFTHCADSGDADKPINPAAACSVMWMVSAFTQENGATRLVPGSHLLGEQPDPAVPYKVETIAGAASAGAALIFDSRMWHATGANRTDAPRIGIINVYCGPQWLALGNYTLGATDDIVATASPELLALLGFRVWDGYGKLDDPGVEYISRPNFAGPVPIKS